MAEAAKKLGNAALQAKKYDEAIGHYTDAIALDGSQHTFYSNRAAAYQSKGDYENALADAEKCVSLNPTWAKDTRGKAPHCTL